MKILRSNIIKSVYILLLLFSIVLSNTFSYAQVKFSAVCPNKKIGKNEYLQLQYIVENASHVEQILPPSFKNFSIVSGPNQQSGMSNINGKIKQYIAMEFILKPQKPGNFVFPSATARADGKNLLSNSLSIEVTNNYSSGSSGGTSFSLFGNIMADVLPESPVHQYDDYILKKKENVDDKIKRNLFVNVTVDKTSCHVGEPIVASYKLYTRLKSESNLTKSLSFNGFSVTEMEMSDNYQLSTEKYNGREYSVYTLRKVQLYLLQAGIVELEPIEVENAVTFIKADYANANKGDIFFDMMRNFADASVPREAIEERKVTLQSKLVNITIKSLPELNQPKDFKGAVGDFSIVAEIPKKTMTVDEAANLIITISGNGNIQMVNAPDIGWPDGVETFEPKSSENIDKTAVPLKGHKTFNYTFTFLRSGKYSIPPVSLSYFDLTSQLYKTISTRPFEITVKQGSRIKRAIANRISNIDNGKLQTFIGKIFDLRWILIAAFLMVTGLLFWLINKRRKKNVIASKGTVDSNNTAKKEGASENPNEEKVMLNPLHEAEAMLLANDANNFYNTINNCIRKYLSIKLKFPEKELTKKKINELLDKSNVGISTTIMLTSLLEDIELNLYAPLSTTDQIKQVYEKASGVIALLDRQL